MGAGEEAGHDAISRAIIESALAEVQSVGQADFAVERVAKGAFCSVGAVYERWSDRRALLAELARGPITSGIKAGLANADSATSAVTWMLTDGRTQLLLASEIILAGGNATEVREPAIDVWNELESGLARHMSPAIAWYVATYAVGNALLGALGVTLEDEHQGRVRWLSDVCSDADLSNRRGYREVSPHAVNVPTLPSPSRTDEVSLALISAAQLLLSERGAEGATTRHIAAGAGVTTGALYRRYDGKSRLMADVLLTQLEPDRYAWTWELVQALASEDPVGQSASILANRMVEVAGDLPAQQVLLQVGVAARNDPMLRAQVVERIRIAQDARADMIRHFVDAGILRDDIAPAVLAWGFQVVPVGIRATLPLGTPLEPAKVAAATEVLLESSMTR